LLGIDEFGNTVIIELKRDLIPRKALAQAIDYASDIATWSPDMLDEKCEKFTGGSLKDFIRNNFPNENLDWDAISINNSQRILLVGTLISEHLERMVNWLSENYDMLINAVIISYGKTSDGNEVIAATTIVPEEIEKERSKKKAKKISDFYDEEYHLKNRPENIVILYKKLKDRIMKLGDDVQLNPVKSYISFKTGTRVFAYILILNRLIRVYIMNLKEEFKDPENWLKNVPEEWKWGNISQFEIDNEEKINYAINLIKQSYGFFHIF